MSHEMDSRHSQRTVPDLQETGLVLHRNAVRELHAGREHKGLCQRGMASRSRRTVEAYLGPAIVTRRSQDQRDADHARVERADARFLDQQAGRVARSFRVGVGRLGCRVGAAASGMGMANAQRPR